MLRGTSFLCGSDPAQSAQGVQHCNVEVGESLARCGPRSQPMDKRRRRDLTVNGGNGPYITDCPNFRRSRPYFEGPFPNLVCGRGQYDHLLDAAIGDELPTFGSRPSVRCGPPVPPRRACRAKRADCGLVVDRQRGPPCQQNLDGDSHDGECRRQAGDEGDQCTHVFRLGRVPCGTLPPPTRAQNAGAAALPGLSSAFGASATSASVVISSEATDAASCSAVRTTLAGSMTPAPTRS